MALKITQKKGLVGANPKQRKNMQSLRLSRIKHNDVRHENGSASCRVRVLIKVLN